MANLSYSKLTGSGNDFILIDNMNLSASADDIRKIVPKVCARGLSIGADGLIIIEPHENLDFRWHFYNADGSDATMCGNGARCAARFAYLKGYTDKQMSFLTGAGVIQAEITSAPNVKVLLTPYKDLRLEERYNFVDTGVPHIVMFFDDVEEIDVNTVGRVLRHEEDANINFVKVLDKNTLRVRTFERGVEAETLACGTGSVASAIIAIQKGLVISPVHIKTTGNIDLIVYYEGDNLYLEGEARLLTDGIITEEAVNY